MKPGDRTHSPGLRARRSLEQRSLGQEVKGHTAIFPDWRSITQSKDRYQTLWPYNLICCIVLHLRHPKPKELNDFLKSKPEYLHLVLSKVVACQDATEAGHAIALNKWVTTYVLKANCVQSAVPDAKGDLNSILRPLPAKTSSLIWERRLTLMRNELSTAGNMPEV